MKKGIFVVLVVMIIVIAVLSGCSLKKKNIQKVTSSSSLVSKLISKASSSQSKSSASVSKVSSTNFSAPQNVVGQSTAPIVQHKEAINKVIPKKVRKVPVKKSQDKKINIKNGDEASKYLKQQLGYGNDPNVSAGADEQISGKDDWGSYYTVQLVYLPDRFAGKTGTMGYYFVYQDGRYRQQLPNIPND